MTVVFHVANARLGFLASIGVLTKSGEKILQSLLVQFVLPLAGPLFRPWTAFAVDGVGDLVEVFFGVAAVLDLDCAGARLVGHVPVIGGAIGDDHHPFGFGETAAGGFSPDARGELGGILVGVARGRTLDGG